MHISRFCRVALIAGSVAPVAGFVPAAPAVADEILYVEPPTVGCVELSSLPPDVLGCNVCRIRLGLAPIADGGPLEAAEIDPSMEGSVPAASQSVSDAGTSNDGEPVSPREASADPLDNNPQSGPVGEPGAAGEAQLQERQVLMLRRLVQEVSRIERENRRTTESLRGEVESLRKQLDLARQAVAQLEARLAAEPSTPQSEMAEESQAASPPAAEDAATADALQQTPGAPETPAGSEAPDAPAAAEDAETPADPEATQPQGTSQKRDI